MHPLILEQIRTIDQHLNNLRAAIEDQRELLDKRDEEHEKLQREQFRQRKHEVTIGHMAEDLEKTQKRIQVYEAERTKVHESLEEVLGALKGLRASMTGEAPDAS